MKSKLITLAPLLLTVACSGTGASYEPKLAATPNPGYETDLEQCRQLAKTEGLWNAETRTTALVGTVAGALAGAADSGAGAGALVGGATGATAGALNTRHERKTILLECLKPRGQPVAG